MALLAAAVALLALTLFALNNKPPFKALDELTSEDVGRALATRGWVAGISEHSDVVRLRLCAARCITFVALGRDAVALKRSGFTRAARGALIEVWGVVGERGGELELVARGEAARIIEQRH